MSGGRDPGGACGPAETYGDARRVQHAGGLAAGLRQSRPAHQVLVDVDQLGSMQWPARVGVQGEACVADWVPATLDRPELTETRDHGVGIVVTDGADAPHATAWYRR
ncbi:MAG: hypothetical protein JWN52_4380 [Actinomycetia bacterium]|nr:hypothetical protein [Actinomycetes bacterium]